MIALGLDEIHLWHTDAFVYEDVYFNFLSDKEKKEANEITRPTIKEAFIRNKYLMRIVLSKYIKKRPEEIVVFRNKYGKPFINSDISFNVSHSKNAFVIALQRQAALGIDIEYICPKAEEAGMLSQIATDAEQKTYTAFTLDTRSRFFHRLWSRKEACIKAVGKGFSMDPKLISVWPDNALRQVIVENYCLLLQELQLYAGYVCALATDRDTDSIIKHKLL